jgi:hypothetical protein
MKLRIFSSVIIFLSAYSPLAIIFCIQNYDFEKQEMLHPHIIWPILGLAVVSCIILWATVSLPKVSMAPVTVKSVSNKSSELVSYTIPYMVSFFVIEHWNTQLLISFAFFMFIMFWLTLKTHTIFNNPILAMLGYNIFDVHYEKNGREYQDYWLAKGGRLRKNEQCRIVEISEQLYLVTERNPEV